MNDKIIRDGDYRITIAATVHNKKLSQSFFRANKHLVPCFTRSVEKINGTYMMHLTIIQQILRTDVQKLIDYLKENNVE